MKMAIIVQCHAHPERINQIVDFFLDDCFDIFIHIDLKSNIRNEINLRKNVYIINNRVDVKWGRFSQVQATLNSFQEIQNTNNKYKYIHLISGDDFPVKDINHFKRFFGINNRQFIDVHPLPNPNLVREGKDRYQVYYPLWLIDRPIIRYKRIARVVYRELIMKIPLLKRKLPENTSFYYGSQWFSITYDCMIYILSFIKENSDIVDFFRNTIYPDEMFFQTIIMNSEFSDLIEDGNLRYIDWSEGNASPKAILVEDAKKALNSPSFFARKIVDQSVVDYIKSQLT